MTLEKVVTGIDALEKEFQHFQNTQQERLNYLEQKVSDLPLFRKQLTSDRRPEGSTKEGSLKPHLMRSSSIKAFDAYVRGHADWDIKALSTGEVPGSYLMPEVIQERIAKELEAGTFRSIARQMSVSGGSIEVIIDQDLPEVGWVGEAAERPETAVPSLEKIKISLNELYAKPKATRNFSMMGPSILKNG